MEDNKEKDDVNKISEDNLGIIRITLAIIVFIILVRIFLLWAYEDQIRILSIIGDRNFQVRPEN